MAVWKVGSLNFFLLFGVKDWSWFMNMEIATSSGIHQASRWQRQPKVKEARARNSEEIHRFMTIITINSYAQKIQCQKNLSFAALSVGVVEAKAEVTWSSALICSQHKIARRRLIGPRKSSHTLKLCAIGIFQLHTRKNLFSSHHSHTHGQSRVSRKDLHSYINEAKMKEQKHITKLSL